jgi:DNA repair protein RecO (recombination protein O)
MYKKIRTEGLVLKKIPSGEADYLFSIFSKDLGKIQVLAKAIRKISSKLKNQIDVLNLVKIEFVQGKGNLILTDAILVSPFFSIKKDLMRLKISFKILEILQNFLPPETKEERIYKISLLAFKKLEKNIKPLNVFSVYLGFFWIFFALSGYGVDFYRCFRCQKKLKKGINYFSLKEKAIFCKICYSQGGIPLSENHIKILRFVTENFNLADKLRAKKDDLLDLIKLSESYLKSIEEI